MADLKVISTEPYHGYGVSFSPFHCEQMAFVGGLNYGIAGSGVLIVYQLLPESYREMRRYSWKDVLYDVTWSEINQNILVAAAGDGRIVFFDHSHPQAGPTSILSEHKAEVSSIEWSISRQDQYIISGSWDKTIKQWDPSTGQCISTLTGHDGLVYCTSWSPYLSMTISSVSSDGTLKIWDLSSLKITADINVGCGEILSCSWNKYNKDIICTGGVDNTVKIWDIRQLSIPLLVMSGHTQSVKQVKFDPHSSTHIASCSYDFTVRIWDTANAVHPLQQTLTHHTEFTYSIDFNMLSKGLISDCSWDKTLKVYTPSCLSSFFI